MTGMRLRVNSSPQTVLQSSFSDLAGLGYLGATANQRQPLCGNIEGWGPLSPYRYDFTPCFLDVWISTVAVLGILFGGGAVWWLLKRKTPQPVQRNWHFYTKLVRRRRSTCAEDYVFSSPTPRGFLVSYSANQSLGTHRRIDNYHGGSSLTSDPTLSSSLGRRLSLLDVNNNDSVLDHNIHNSVS